MTIRDRLLGPHGVLKHTRCRKNCGAIAQMVARQGKAGQTPVSGLMAQSTFHGHMSFRTPTEIPNHTPPDRVRLPDRLQKQLLERLMPALDRALGKVDDYLFDRSREGDEEFGLLALRELRRQRGQITRRYEEVVQAGFRNLRGESEWFPVDGRPSGMSLLSEEDLEEQLAVEQLGDSLVRLHGPGLEMASKRVAHVSGREELQAQDNPLAPAFLATALRNALGQSEEGRRQRIVPVSYTHLEVYKRQGPAGPRSTCKPPAC